MIIGISGSVLLYFYLLKSFVTKKDIWKELSMSLTFFGGPSGVSSKNNRKVMKYFSDQEINNECFAVCDGEFFECTKNCENSECSRKCFEELDGTFQ